MPSTEAAKRTIGNIAKSAFQAITTAQFGDWSSINFCPTRPGTDCLIPSRFIRAVSPPLQHLTRRQSGNPGERHLGHRVAHQAAGAEQLAEQVRPLLAELLEVL